MRDLMRGDRRAGIILVKAAHVLVQNFGAIRLIGNTDV